MSNDWEDMSYEDMLNEDQEESTGELSNQVGSAGETESPDNIKPVVLSKKKVWLVLMVVLIIILLILFFIRGMSVSKPINSGNAGNSGQSKEVSQGSDSRGVQSTTNYGDGSLNLQESTPVSGTSYIDPRKMHDALVEFSSLVRSGIVETSGNVTFMTKDGSSLDIDSIFSENDEGIVLLNETNFIRLSKDDRQVVLGKINSMSKAIAESYGGQVDTVRAEWYTLLNNQECLSYVDEPDVVIDDLKLPEVGSDSPKGTNDLSIELIDSSPAFSSITTNNGMVKGTYLYKIGNSYTYGVELIIITDNGNNLECVYYCPQKTADALAIGAALSVEYSLDTSGNVSVYSISLRN